MLDAAFRQCIDDVVSYVLPYLHALTICDVRILLVWSGMMSQTNQGDTVMEIRVHHFFALLCGAGLISAMAGCAPEETGAITEDGTESVAVPTDGTKEPGGAARAVQRPVLLVDM